VAISRKMIYSSGLVGRGAPASPRDDEDNNPDTLWVLRRSHWASFYGTECDDSPWGGVPVDLAEPSTVFRRWRIPKFRSSSRMMSPLIRFFRNTPNGLRRKEFKYREVHLLKGSMAIKYGRGIIRPCIGDDRDGNILGYDATPAIRCAFVCRIFNGFYRKLMM
jgi:hypothetical protein